ncbi:uncharacterized protein LY89DRAFT_545882, partial [Mollisia scopiformis]
LDSAIRIPSRVNRGSESLLIQDSMLGSGKGLFMTKAVEEGDLIFSIKRPLL